METVNFARRFGMVIPDPAMVLRPLLPFYLERMSDRPLDAGPDTTAFPMVQDGAARDWIIVPDEWPPSVLHAIFVAARRIMPLGPKLALGDRSLEGVPACDALARLARVDLRIIDAEGQEHRIDDFQAMDEAMETSAAFDLLAELAERSRANNRAGAARLIEVTLIAGPAGKSGDTAAVQRVLGAASVPCIFAADDFSFPEDVSVLVSEQLATQQLDEAAREIAAVVYDDVAIELDDDDGEYGDPFGEWLQDMRHLIAESCMEGGRFRLHQAWVAASWLAQRTEIASDESDIASIQVAAEPLEPGSTTRRIIIKVTDRSGHEASRSFDGPLPRAPREPPGTSLLDGIEP